MTNVGVTLVRVDTEVVVIVTTLKVLVHLQHPRNIGPHIRAQHLGSNGTMVRHAHGLTHVVTQRGHDDLGVGPGLFGQRCGLQTVRELVGSKAVGDRGKRSQHCQN